LAYGVFDGRTIQPNFLHVLLDTRDNAFSPERGQWFEARLYYSAPAFGGQGAFTQTTIDYRWFRGVWLDHVIAVNAYVSTTHGTAGWYALPRFGGQFLMRGYYSGRYIDNHLWATQIDYRFPIWWRLGLVVFAGVGDVAAHFSDLVSSQLKVSYGSGLRIMVDKEQKINMRLDLGFTRSGDVNFYFTFKEAF
jgi:outer membrane protein assembly factor BamA